MNTMELSLLIAALLLAVLAIAGVLFYALRVKTQLQQQAQGREVLQRDLRALVNAAVQVGERVSRMEGEIKALQQRQQELGVRQEKMALSEPQEVSFEQAIKLAQKGAPVEELMEICSISRGEAELIAMMHRLDSGS